MRFSYKLDKFERWLKKHFPEHMDEYERGYGEGNIEIREIKYSDRDIFYHLYLDGELLGTLVE